MVGRIKTLPSCSGPNSWIMLCYGAKRNGFADEVKVVHQLTLKWEIILNCPGEPNVITRENMEEGGRKGKSEM